MTRLVPDASALWRLNIPRDREESPQGHTALADGGAGKEREMRDQQRNINPTPEARLAMALWSHEYADQGGGSMDFWDGLSPTRKRIVDDVLRGVSNAAIAHCRTLEAMARTPS